VTTPLKVVVTGGAGFIGSHLVDRLLHEGCAVRVIDNLFSSSIQNLAHIPTTAQFQFVNGDIRDTEVLATALQDIDVVFHKAAQRNVALSIREPVLTHDINVTGTLKLLRASVDAGVKRVILASTAAVYGIPTKGISEDVRLNPTSPYAVSKVAAEHYSLAFQQLYDLEAVCFRYFNVYGPRQQTGGAINTFLRQVVNDHPPSIFGDGEQIRDFVHVSDVVTANLLAMSHPATGIFNIASGRSISIKDLAHFIIQLSGKPLVPQHLPPRLNDPKWGGSNIEKARRILSFNPQVSVQEGIPPLFQRLMHRSG
jgi:UDP-glucose 4-epimerase